MKLHIWTTVLELGVEDSVVSDYESYNWMLAAYSDVHDYIKDVRLYMTKEEKILLHKCKHVEVGLRVQRSNENSTSAVTVLPYPYSRYYSRYSYSSLRLHCTALHCTAEVGTKFTRSTLRFTPLPIAERGVGVCARHCWCDRDGYLLQPRQGDARGMRIRRLPGTVLHVGEGEG